MKLNGSTVALMIAATMIGGCSQDEAGGAVDVSAANGIGANVAPPASGPDTPPITIQRNEPTPAGGPQSAFTNLDVAECKLIERNDEEAGYARHRCVGAAGYQLELVESDLRQTIEVIRPGDRAESLELSSLVAGGGFSSVGKTAEWRGTDPAKPRTLTFRYGVNEDPDPKVTPRSYLVVARLDHRLASWRASRPAPSKAPRRAPSPTRQCCRCASSAEVGANARYG